MFIFENDYLYIARLLKICMIQFDATNIYIFFRKIKILALLLKHDSIRQLQEVVV